MTATEYRADALTRLTDTELVKQTYAAVGRVGHVDDPLADELSFLITEALERFAPEAELESRIRANEDGAAGLTCCIERMSDRHAARLTASAARSEL